MTKIVAIKAKNNQHCSLLLACKKCSLHPQPDAVDSQLIALDLTIFDYNKRVRSLKLNYIFRH